MVEAIAEPEPEPVIAAEPEPEPVVEAIAEPEPEPVVEAIAEPEPEPVVEAIAEPEPEPVAAAAELAPEAPTTGDPVEIGRGRTKGFLRRFRPAPSAGQASRLLRRSLWASHRRTRG